VLLCLSGCGPAPIYEPVEVWNRTLDPIYLLDQDGRRLDVAACGHATVARFRVNHYQVLTEGGLWFSGQVGGTGAPGRERWVIVTGPFDNLRSVEPLDAEPSLPPCLGHATVAPTNEPP
jgi:hypothetical protein